MLRKFRIFGPQNSKDILRCPNGRHEEKVFKAVEQYPEQGVKVRWASGLSVL